MFRDKDRARKQKQRAAESTDDKELRR